MQTRKSGSSTRLRGLERIDLTKLLVLGDVQPRKALLALAGIGDVDRERVVMAPVGATNQQQTRPRALGGQLAKARLT